MTQAKDFINELIGQKKCVKHILKLGDYSNSKQEVNQISVCLIKDEKLKKDLKDQFNGDYHVKDADIELKVVANKLKAAIIFLEK